MATTTTPVESQVLAIAPKFTAFLSICGSLGIVVKVLLRRRKKKNNAMHRIVLGMSICDILASIWFFTGTWAIPSGTLSWFGDGQTETIFWAAGNSISCSVAGFFTQFAVATPLYNTALAVFYLLVINYGWKDSRIAKIEWLFHSIPLGYASITATFAVVADLYGHVEWTCWILPSSSSEEEEEFSPMQRKFRMIQWILLFGPVWLCIIIVTFIFIILYRKMKYLERTMHRQYPYSFHIPNNIIIPDDIEKGSHDKDDTKDDDSNNSQEEESKNSSDQEEDEHPNNNNRKSVKFKEEKEYNIEGKEQPSRIVTDKTITVITSFPSQQKDDDNNIKGTQERQRQRRQFSSILSSFTRSSINNCENNHQQNQNATKSKKIAVQGLLYVVAFYITWLFPTITRLTDMIASKSYFPIQFLDTFLIPLQGFLNFLIYIRPRYLFYRKKNNNGFWKSLFLVVFEIRE